MTLLYDDLEEKMRIVAVGCDQRIKNTYRATVAGDNISPPPLQLPFTVDTPPRSCDLARTADFDFFTENNNLFSDYHK